jgi:hypothetical protein
MRTPIHISGKKTGHLTLLAFEKKEGRRVYYRYKCDCGNECVKLPANVRDNSSCGCKVITQRSDAGKKGVTHGQSKRSRLYQVWENMKQRCLNPKTKFFSYYGGRGIGICNDWIKFEPFQEWALSHGYAETLTLDREDGDGNYDPSNCRWITQAQQLANTRKNIQIEYGGETHHIAEWARRLDMDRSLLGHRLKIWPVEKAFTEPVKRRRKAA